MASDRRIASRLLKRYKQEAGSVRTAAFGDDGDVVPNTPSGAGAAKDQLGGGGQNQFSSPGGAGMRQIPKGHVYDPRALKPMAKMLWACSVSLGHALTAYREFTRFKSSAISPDGMVGGRGYVMTVKDVRTRLQEACEALSAVSDTIHDEINAPHWGPQLDDMGDAEKVDFDQYVDEAESILEDPEAYGQEESEEVEDGKSRSKGKNDADESEEEEEEEEEEDEPGWDDEAEEAADDTEEQPEADGVKLSPIEEGSDEESDDDSEGEEEELDDDRHSQAETGGKDRFDESGDEEEPSWEDDPEEEESDDAPEGEEEESEDVPEGEIPPADDIDDDDLFADLADIPATPTDSEESDDDSEDEEDEEDEDDDDEEDSSSELPDGGDSEVVARGDENGDKKRKKSSLRYARSSVPGQGGSVPRVDTYDRGSPRGPYDSFNEDEPVPSNDWTRQIHDNAYQSEWKTDFSREGESAMPSGDLVPRDAKDFGLGWGTSGKGLDHRGEPGSAAKLPADPGRSTKPLESDAMPFRQDIEKTVFANSFLPNDNEGPVSRSDYYRGPKGNLAQSELPNDGSVHRKLDKDLMNTGYRDERIDNPYVSRNDQIERTDSIYLDSYWNRDK
jgi:hypothetical protein